MSSINFNKHFFVLRQNYQKKYCRVTYLSKTFLSPETELLKKNYCCKTILLKNQIIEKFFYRKNFFCYNY